MLLVGQDSTFLSGQVNVTIMMFSASSTYIVAMQRMHEEGGRKNHKCEKTDEILWFITTGYIQGQRKEKGVEEKRTPMSTDKRKKRNFTRKPLVF